MQSRNVKFSYPMIIVRLGRLDPILVRRRLRKVPVFAIYTETRKRRFQKIPLWRAFSESYVFGDHFHRIRVDGRRICKEKLRFTDTCRQGLRVGTNIEICFFFIQCYLLEYGLTKSSFSVKFFF